MKTAQDIIIAPIITEKSMAGIADKKYTFKVAKDANKIEIAEAVEKIFKVDVAKVNTINTYDVINADTLVIVKGAVAKLEEVYA